MLYFCGSGPANLLLSHACMRLGFRYTESAMPRSIQYRRSSQDVAAKLLLRGQQSKDVVKVSILPEKFQNAIEAGMITVEEGTQMLPACKGSTNLGKFAAHEFLSLCAAALDPRFTVKSDWFHEMKMRPQAPGMTLWYLKVNLSVLWAESGEASESGFAGSSMANAPLSDSPGSRPGSSEGNVPLPGSSDPRPEQVPASTEDSSLVEKDMQQGPSYQQLEKMPRKFRLQYYLFKDPTTKDKTREVLLRNCIKKSEVKEIFYSDPNSLVFLAWVTSCGQSDTPLGCIVIGKK